MAAYIVGRHVAGKARATSCASISGQATIRVSSRVASTSVGCCDILVSVYGPQVVRLQAGLTGLQVGPQVSRMQARLLDYRLGRGSRVCRLGWRPGWQAGRGLWVTSQVAVAELGRSPRWLQVRGFG